VQHGLRTIEIPQRFSLPREVHISGVVDDDLSIDGSVVQGGQYVTPFFPQCNPAHLVCYSFTATNRTFTVAAIDNHGGNTSYALRICFSTLGAGGACCEGTTCSVKPQCQCQGTGKTFKGVGTTCSPNPCVCEYGACCGPDTFVSSEYGERMVCRQESEQQCLQRGGTWYTCKLCLASSDYGAFGCLSCGPAPCNPLP
jgi:hypothetical protein